MNVDHTANGGVFCLHAEPGILGLYETSEQEKCSITRRSDNCASSQLATRCEKMAFLLACFMAQDTIEKQLIAKLQEQLGGFLADGKQSVDARFAKASIPT